MLHTRNLRLRPSVRACLLAAALLVLATASTVEAAVVWPADSSWNELLDGSGNPITDPDGPNPDTTDIIGDSSYPAGYWYYDGTHLMFRMRLDKNPGSPLTSVWQIMLDTDDDDGIDWVLQLDESGDDLVELVDATTEGPDFSDVVLAGTGTWDGATADFTQIGVTGDGYKFGSADDYFLDIAITFSDFETVTGISTSDAFRVGLTTSTTHSGINKEFPQSLTSSSSVADGFGGSFSANGDIVPNPEPGTWALFGLGTLLLGAVVRRRARRRPVRGATVPPV